MPVYDTTCLLSTVLNASGATKKFGFLPPHGKELEDGEELTMIGDIGHAIVRGREGTHERQLKAFQDAVSRGDLVVKSTPRVVLYDEQLDAIKVLRINNNTLGAVDPCWETSL